MAEQQEREAKRLKVDPSQQLPFHPTLLDPANIENLRKAHDRSIPYRHAVIDQLFDKDFLKRARKEITEQLSFREKETDIYKASSCLESIINQTGDLTNLSGLPASELALLPTLLELRDALYGPAFRSFLQQVTGCGPLSGSKTDMSCAEYSQGCYLLNHDDVIGTRRISFILYLVLDEPEWQPEWGGALELYPVLEADEQNPDRPNVPTAKPSTCIPPAFNQMVFFEVQPGHSFHSVEEVVVHGDQQKGGVGARVSLSGWFHKPVEGEEGYEGSEGFQPKSSLQQLYATSLSAPTPYAEPLPLPLPTIPFPSDLEYLRPLVNPAYLTSKIITLLRSQFIEQSHLVLADFIHPAIANELEGLIRERDQEMEKGRRGAIVNGQKTDKVPPHTAGEDAETGWAVVGPPHLQRYLALAPSASSSSSDSGADRLATLLRQIHTLFTSRAFSSLLANLTSLLPTAYTTSIRRFRPGLDYTLARGESSSDPDAQAKLDVGLGLTPRCEKEEEREVWEGGEAGGWDIWLANEEGGDEATYGGGGGGKTSETNGDGTESEEKPTQAEEEPAGDEAEEEEDDGPLLALEPEWNRLHLVLRDPGVLSFVKYVSARAPASRWDVVGEWEVQGIEEEEEEGGEE
ncbi:hypothetical protein JCM10908_002542 [Rhodotorula pacifica]|uniref:oxidative DNA demethylase n=1 Tax=Rhodotorula pacifica TaxID=1495444 RepID=UPI003181AE27